MLFYFDKKNIRLYISACKLYFNLILKIYFAYIRHSFVALDLFKINVDKNNIQAYILRMTKKEAMKYFRVNQDLANAGGVCLQAVRQWKADKDIPLASQLKVKLYIKKHKLKPVYCSEYKRLIDTFNNMSKTEQLNHAYDVPGGKQETHARTQDD